MHLIIHIAWTNAQMTLQSLILLLRCILNSMYVQLCHFHVPVRIPVHVEHTVLLDRPQRTLLCSEVLLSVQNVCKEWLLLLILSCRIISHVTDTFADFFPILMCDVKINWTF